MPSEECEVRGLLGQRRPSKEGVWAPNPRTGPRATRKRRVRLRCRDMHDCERVAKYIWGGSNLGGLQIAFLVIYLTLTISRSTHLKFHICLCCLFRIALKGVGRSVAALTDVESSGNRTYVRNTNVYVCLSCVPCCASRCRSRVSAGRKARHSQVQANIIHMFAYIFLVIVLPKCGAQSFAHIGAFGCVA